MSNFVLKCKILLLHLTKNRVKIKSTFKKFYVFLDILHFRLKAFGKIVKKIESFSTMI